MRIQFFIIAILVSLLAWVGLYHAVRIGAQTFQRTGVVPNLQIKHRVNKVANIAWDVVSPQ